MSIENIIKGEPDWHVKINNNENELSNKIGDLTGLPHTNLADNVKQTNEQLSDMEKYFINIIEYGAIGDGTSHKLSTKYSTLADAKIDFPSATSLDDEIDVVAIQKAIDSNDNQFNILYSPGNKAYVINKSIFINNNRKFSVEFNYSTLYMLEGANFTNDFIFILNSTDGINPLVYTKTRETTYPVVPYLSFLTFENVKFKNDSTNIHLKMIFTGLSMTYKNLLSINCEKGLVFPNNVYVDSTKINNITLQPSSSSLTSDIFAVYKNGGGGDAWEINQIYMPTIEGTSIYINENSNCEITNIVNCKIVLENCIGMSFNGIHLESGKITLINTSAEISNFMINYYGTYSCIEVLADANNKSLPCDLKNGTFRTTYLTNDNQSSKISETYADLTMVKNANISISNVYRDNQILSAIDVTKKEHNFMGFWIQYDDNTRYTLFNNFSHIYSKRCAIENGVLVYPASVVSYTYGDGNIMQNATTINDNAFIWRGTLGTYFYKSQIILDLYRKIGQTASIEKSFTITDNTVRVKFTFTDIDKNLKNAYVRIYRGTTSGSYNQFVDIPIILSNNLNLYDDGININGFSWIARTTGAVDSMAESAITKVVRTLDINTSMLVECSGNGDTAPTTGTWAVKDRKILVPGAGKYTGLVCVTAGTPGAWLGYGAIASS